MSDSEYEAVLAHFVEEIKSGGATKILELGTVDASLLIEVIDQVDWATEIELHCTDTGSSHFDDSLTAAVSDTNLDVRVIKHVGGETEIYDAVMQEAETAPFDAIFISSALSDEGLLTACLVSNESLGSGGIFSIGLAENAFTSAISTFQDMYGEAYEERKPLIFLKK